MKIKRSMRETIRLNVVILFCLMVASGSAQESLAQRIKGYHWVGTWGASAQLVEKELLPEGFAQLDGMTLRQVVHVSIGGRQLRVRISNTFADWNDDLKISAASVSLSVGSHAINADSTKALTFHGRSSVIVPYGVLMISDPVEFDLPAGSDLAVTIHIADATEKITGHRSARGEVVHLQRGEAVMDESLPQSVKNKCWHYLSGVDVLAPDTSRALVCLGDSITDGKGSTEGANRRWPDLLAQRMRANSETAGIGVLNQGIGGNGLWRGGIGQTALQRLERDVLSQPAVKWLIILEGINDLGGGKISADEMIVAYEQIVIRARERGMLVYGATILPCGESFYFTPELEEKRQKVNQWIRNSGVFDAVIDWDAALRDPEKPAQLLPAADCGDHLHLNDEGSRIMAESIDLNLFKAGDAETR